MGERLSVHGIRFERVDRAVQAANVEAFRAKKVEFSTKPYEGHFTAKIDGEWQSERRDIPAGSLIVPIAQPKARLVMTLLEPQAGDSYAAWGFFNFAFRAEGIHGALRCRGCSRVKCSPRDPAIAAEFKRLLATDPQFAKDPQRRGSTSSTSGTRRSTSG